MKIKKNLLLFIFVITSHLISAQQMTIKGVVTDSYGPLPDASIYVKGSTKGVTTDFDGNYSITVQKGDVLIYSFIGHNEKEVLISNQTTVNVTLEEGTTLNEVIITAQGIKREKKALGYSITKIDGKELENKPEADVSRSLQGKIAGVQISAQSGSSGEGTSITIRSSLSLFSSNTPLIVVNNVPFDGNLLDINPNNIKSINVLKGLNASVLYGSEGRNGVILIQTKSGASDIGTKSVNASFSQTTYVNTISGLPEYQNKYGSGSDFNYVGSNVGTWGPAFSSLDVIPHPYSTNPMFPEFNDVTIPYQAARNNVKNFFKEGIGKTFSLNISTTQENTAFNISAGFTDEEGIIGHNNLKRFNLGLGGTIKISDKLKIDATLNYSNRKSDRYDEDELYSLLLFIPRGIDVFNLPYQTATGENAYYRNSLNPNWLLNNTNRNDNITRTFGSVNTNYNLTDNINLIYRVGFENDSKNEFDFSNKGGADNDKFINGFLNTSSRKKIIVDQTIMANGAFKVNEKINLDAQVGLNSKVRNTKSSKTENKNQIVYNFLRPNNFDFKNNGYSEYRSNLAGIFGQLQFSYENYLYLTLSGRNDWGSTVEKENRSLFYPGVSVSFIPTSAFNFDSDIIKYLKVRGAYATSSGFPGTYDTRPTLSQNPRTFVHPVLGDIITNSSSSRLSNSNLKPELHTEFEFGIESKLFKNSVTLEAAVYKRISIDQILSNIGIPTETGFNITTINAGRIDTQGLEIDLGIDLLKKEDFKWNFKNLFNTYISEVIDLPIGRASLGGRKWAIKGQPLGVVLGDYAVRDKEGNLLINPNNGNIISSDDVGFDDEIIADPTPDWTVTNINTFTYKNFTLSTQLEYTHGGENYSDLADDLLKRGVTRDTENREGSFIIPGVYGDPSTGIAYLDASGNTIPNTIQLSGNDIAFNHFYSADDQATFDTSVFRIREIALGYTLPKKQLQKLPFESVSFTLSGRNLYYYAPGFPKYTNLDPELDTSDNKTRTPTTSRYSLSLILKF